MDEEGEEMNSLFEGMDPPLLLLRISTILLSLALFKSLLFSFLFSVLFLILFFFFLNFYYNCFKKFNLKYDKTKQMMFNNRIILISGLNWGFIKNIFVFSSNAGINLQKIEISKSNFSEIKKWSDFL